MNSFECFTTVSCDCNRIQSTFNKSDIFEFLQMKSYLISIWPDFLTDIWFSCVTFTRKSFETKKHFTICSEMYNYLELLCIYMRLKRKLSYQQIYSSIKCWLNSFCAYVKCIKKCRVVVNIKRLFLFWNYIFSFSN